MIKFRLFDSFLEPVVHDVLQQRKQLNELQLSYLTNREIDSTVIESMNLKERRIAQQKLLEAFSHDLPFIQGVDILKLLELRKEEGSAFLDYRSAIRSVLKEIEDLSDPRQIKEAIDDIVRPEVVKIQRSVDIHKSTLQRKVKRSLIYNSIALTASLFAWKFFNINPALVISASSYISTKQVYETVTSYNDIPKTAQENSYYFLWKINNQKKNVKIK